MAFLTEDFLLSTPTSRHLYHKYAERIPIFDFHSHLSPADIAENKRFKNLTEIWIDGDHYKWRAMRSNGISERYCSGDASDYEKFMAWARTVPRTLRNPLYHWTHLELNRYFGIEDLLDESSADKVWQRTNRTFDEGKMTPRDIFRSFHVEVLCTTDDPADSLDLHRKINESGIGTLVLPTFRPDGALRVSDPVRFNQWTNRLASASNIEISRLSNFLDALAVRHAAFHQSGCRLSDHGMNHCFAEPSSEREAAASFNKLRSGAALNSGQIEGLCSYLMVFFGQLDASRKWTKQLHLGALRNVNSCMVERLGPDVGFDSIGDWSQAASLAAYCDWLNSNGSLPKMIVFNLNPADNYIFATMAGNFPEENVRGKVQFGSGWWFLDQKEGIEWQLNALSNSGLLANFVGMVTDSRSFMSCPRHEYFRRVLCNLLGSDIEQGLLPEDETMMAQLIEDLCIGNASRFLGLSGNHSGSNTSGAEAIE